MRKPAALILIAFFLCMSFVNPVFGGQFDDAVAARERGDYATTFRLMKPLAQHGYAEAQFVVGLRYAIGQEVPRDDTEAVKWYRKAADQGYADAQYTLGHMYLSGRGVLEDDAEAAKWFRKAADQGNANAQHDLGNMYDNGKGILQDYTEALKWYRKAAEQGDADAQTNLGVMYARGEGVPQNYILAHMWLNIAVSHFPASKKIRREKALHDRDIVASKMTPAQIAEAQR